MMGSILRDIKKNFLLPSGERLLQVFSKIGYDPNDDDALRHKKLLYVSFTLIGDIPASLLVSIYHFTAHAIIPSFIQFLWAMLALGNFVFFAIRRNNYQSTVVRGLILYLIMPIWMTIASGGLIYSGAVIMGTVGVPIGAILFLELSDVPIWVATQLLVLALSALIDPFTLQHNSPELTSATNTFVGNLLVFMVIVDALLYYFVYQRNLAAHLLKIEQNKSDALLLNILPKEIARVLKNGSCHIAEQFENVSVLFADLVDFTVLSADLQPQEIVSLLNAIFSQFDALVEKYQLEKIKTIGDCYMVAAGVPNPRPDHARSLTCLALDMAEAIKQIPADKNHQLQMRIGINSGAVVAGVIGRNKFIYDLWGDTVNTASRMESHGCGGEIQITSSTYELIKHEFICAEYGKILVKGKGEMEIWHVKCLKPKPLELGK